MKKFIFAIGLLAMVLSINVASAKNVTATTSVGCGPATQTTTVNEYVSFGVLASFNGQGAGKKIHWSAPGGTLVDGNTTGFTFVTAYSAVGTYTVTVSSPGYLPATCTVIVQ